ncbi:MAG TPA: hypothetical protein VFQ54_03235, partial [Thermomicrobiales bacterium]|nr:hypothetical protein [Thermomicrobiales bacterium]
AARFDVEEDPQQTQPLTGGIPDREPPSPWALNGSSSARWSPDSTETAYTSPINATSVSTPPIATRFDVDSTAEAMNPGRTDVWAADYDGPSPGIVTDQGEYAIEEESLRGFFLGVTAIVLIIIVAAIYGWTITPDGSFRDTIQGWINDIS